MRRLIAITFGLVAATVAVVALLVGPKPDHPPRQEADGLWIRTVGEALALREQLDETQPIAVRGWYSSGFPHSCPAPMGPNGRLRNPSPLEIYCRRGEVVLTELQEAAVVVQVEQGLDSTSVSQQIRPLTGPHLDPVEIGYVTDIPITPPAVDPAIPQPIVAVGHFRDHRAADCLPEEVAFCLGVFVIDHLPVVRGELQSSVRQPIPGLVPAVRTPDDIERHVRRELGEDITILSTAAYRGSEVPGAEDRAPRIADRDAVWLVRLIDRGAGAEAPRLMSVVIDDATLDVRWSSEVD